LGITILLKAVWFKASCFEEKIHREVAQVEEGRAKKDLSAKTFSTYSPWRLKLLPKCGSFPEHESKRQYPAFTPPALFFARFHSMISL
jgi:hypothetical protein